MRLSEKTLELSITAQLTHRLGIPNAIWFGLTQKQERQLGYDIASEVPGRLVILQFKASNVIVGPYWDRRRRFTLPHDQLTRLQELAYAFPGSVYYVLPNIGNDDELAINPDLVEQSWLLDVALLPVPFPAATNASGKHYAYIDPPQCEIRSEPVETELITIRDFGLKVDGARQNSQRIIEWLREREFCFKGMRAYGLLLPS